MKHNRNDEFYFTTWRLVENRDLEVTHMNCITSSAPESMVAEIEAHQPIDIPEKQVTLFFDEDDNRSSIL